MSLPKEYIPVINQFLTEATTEDDLHEMIACCCEAWNGNKRNPTARAKAAIACVFEKERRDANTLYNQYRNISLNQCFGESKTQISEWLNLSDWREWD